MKKLNGKRKSLIAIMVLFFANFDERFEPKLKKNVINKQK